VLFDTLEIKKLAIYLTSLIINQSMPNNKIIELPQILKVFRGIDIFLTLFLAAPLPQKSYVAAETTIKANNDHTYQNYWCRNKRNASLKTIQI